VGGGCAPAILARTLTDLLFLPLHVRVAAAAAATTTTTTTTGLALAPAPAAQAPADRARRADLGPPGLLPALALPRGARSDTHTRNLTQRISQIAVYK
jgi:hypothetical protein